MKGSYSTVWYGQDQLSGWRETVISGQAMDRDLEGDVSDVGVYRGTSLIRKRPPPRTVVGP